MTDGAPTMTTTSCRLGPLAQIPVGEGRAFAVGGDQIAVFRLRSGAVHAVSAVCPHAGGPLADGQADESVIVCPLHLNAWEFPTGESTTGQPPIAVYRAEVDDEGHVVVHLPVRA
jgi:nitrite reductase (NADH) small subunit